MATNLVLDDAIILKRKSLGGHKTKRAAVSAALEEYIRHRKQARIIELFGTIDYDPEYDYKRQRRSKRLDDSFRHQHLVASSP